MIKVFKNKHFFPHKKFYFPAGEMGVSFDNEKYQCSEIEIMAHISSMEELMEVVLLTSTLKNMYEDVPITLDLPYIPFARQDRHTAYGAPFSLKVVADILNSQNYKEIICWTPHSNVAELLINNLTVYEPTYDLREKIRGVDENTIIIAPDAGAEKRAYAWAAELKVSEVYVCSKRRNPVTGEIYGMVAPNIPEDKDIVIVDDICDGGKTFIEVEKVLPKKRKSLTLYVTHGIFSKGKNVLYQAGFDKVHSRFDFIYQSKFTDLDKTAGAIISDEN